MDLSRVKARIDRQKQVKEHLAFYQKELQVAKNELKQHENYMLSEWGGLEFILNFNGYPGYRDDCDKLRSLRQKVSDIEEEIKPLENYVDPDELEELTKGMLGFRYKA